MCIIENELKYHKEGCGRNINIFIVNGIGDEGARFMGDMLKVNAGLTILALRGHKTVLETNQK